MHRYILSVVICLFLISGNAQVVKTGVADLSKYSFEENEAVPLVGEWKFYQSAFISPDRPSESKPTHLIPIPKRWDQVGLPNKGYGSYAITLYRSDNTPLGVRIQDQFSAYNLFINGQKVASMGTPGTNASSSKPARKVNLVSIGHINSDTLEIVFHISNFVHRKGGLGPPMVIGSYEKLAKEKFLEDAFDIFLAGCLIMGSFFILGLFFAGRQEKIPLYFALFCLIYSYRIVGWGNYVLHDLVEMPFRLGIILEFSTFYLSGFFFAKYIEALFPEDTPKLIVNIFAYLSLAWAAFSLFPLELVSRFNDYYIYVLIVGMLIIFFVIVRAAINRRTGSQFSIYSTLGIFIVFGMKILAYIDLIEVILIVSVLGQMLFFLLQALILTKRFSMAWRNAKLEAENAVKAKSDFLSIMSHEIRTPLNAVIGTTHHLINHNPREEQLEDLSNLQNASENLLSLVNNILDFNKIEAGKVELEKLSIALEDHCYLIVNTVQPLASEKKLKLSLDYDNSIPKIIKADKNRLSQILINLLSNAIKFTEKGQVKLIVNALEQNEKNVKVLFEVTDTGIGISKTQKDSIFQFFEQANNTITRKYGGTGLGLAITQRLLSLMGSQVFLNSEPGKGSEFSFVLELEIGEKTQEPKKEENPSSLAGFKVLLVEDNPMNILIAKRLLLKWKLDVVVAEDGQIALDKAEQNKFDLILMDLQLPVMDGFQATKSLRNRGFKNPIFALTASPIDADRNILRQLGFDGLISKPYKAEDLYEVLAESLLPN
ncbi:MAG: response regulator [Cyclobacteriaceae bacterium]